jgi:hypothetical protein
MQNPCTTHTFFSRYHIRRDFITVALRISKSVSSFIMREETSPLSRFSLGESLGMVAFQINKSLPILNDTSRRHPAKLSQGSDYFARIRDPISLGSPAKGRLAWPERSAGNPTLMGCRWVQWIFMSMRRPLIAATGGQRRISRLSLCHLACGRLEIRGLQSGVFRDSGQHPRSDLI